MKQQQGLPWWAWLGGAVLLVALIALMIWALLDSPEVDTGEAEARPGLTTSVSGP